MRLVPWDRAVLLTRLSPQEVAQRLRPLIAPPAISLAPPPQPLRGRFDGTRFKVTRVLGTILGLEMNNSWKPVILGSILPRPEGCAIEVTMRPSWAVVGPIAVFQSIFWSLSVMSVYWGLTGQLATRGPGETLVVAVMLLGFSVGMPAAMLASYWSEAGKARDILCGALATTWPTSQLSGPAAGLLQREKERHR